MVDEAVERLGKGVALALQLGRSQLHHEALARITLRLTLPRYSLRQNNASDSDRNENATNATKFHTAVQLRVAFGPPPAEANRSGRRGRDRAPSWPPEARSAAQGALPDQGSD